MVKVRLPTSTCCAVLCWPPFPSSLASGLSPSCRIERETAARISEEIGNLMKEIETLVEEKTKESADMSKLLREGERVACGARSWAKGSGGSDSQPMLGF